jgi:preprotein translocase subunit YajC
MLVAEAAGPLGCARQGGAAGGLGSLLPFMSIFVLFWFMLVRPQQRREKERQALLKGLKKGDSVVTTSGIVGRIHSLTETLIVLEAANRVRFTMLRSHVTGRFDELDPTTGELKGGTSVTSGSVAAEAAPASTVQPAASGQSPSRGN